MITLRTVLAFILWMAMWIIPGAALGGFAGIIGFVAGVGVFYWLASKRPVNNLALRQ